MKSGVYKITNTVSGRVYVGSSSNISKRWLAHKFLLKNGQHHSRLLQRSWDKHGADVFVFEIIVLFPVDLLLQKEQEWIERLNAASPRNGFNVLPTAGSQRGAKRTAQARLNMSKAAKGKKKPKRTPEHQAKLTQARIGKVFSAEVRAKISTAQTGKKRGPHSEATKLKISEAHKGEKPNIEALKKAWAAVRGSKHSMETRQQMSSTHKARFTDPKEKKNRSIAASLGWARRKNNAHNSFRGS